MEKQRADSQTIYAEFRRAQHDRTVKWPTVDGKRMLDLGNLGRLRLLYSSYRAFRATGKCNRNSAGL